MAFSASIEYTLFLADSALILGHRNSEWTGYGPILEQDIALSNIALDLIGQARWLFQHAAKLVNESGAAPRTTEDGLAYGRDSWDFRNCLLVEQVNGDWGRTIMRQFLFSAWQYYYYDQLRQSRDRELAAIAEKSGKEVTYHLRWSSEWVIRLGDGTAESHDRMTSALEGLWPFTGELFETVSYEQTMITAGIAVDPSTIRQRWTEKVGEVLGEAQLSAPQGGAGAGGNGRPQGGGEKDGAGGAGQVWMQTGGKTGKHTEHLGYLLAEMQFLQRAYPNCEW
ncbi:MAG TPA: 1,2-phenylacetyl-CoA epoxidase subunit PaaC [Puia sp.]|nr:1,2-phenylacetyl-CoA epoxidase subunit PaaC [Puia sp.]